MVGITNRVNNVDVIRLPTTTVARGCCTSLPVPVATPYPTDAGGGE